MNNKNLLLLKRLDNEWKLDAKEEDIKYFYHTEETASVLNGEKYMIIGRKGGRKDSYCDLYLQECWSWSICR